MPSAVIKDFIHLTEVVNVQNVIRIKDKIRFIFVICIMLANTSESVIERIALANFFLIKSREDNRTCLLSNCRRIISAIISNNKNIDKLLRVILYTDAVDKVANYRIFVARRIRTA